MKILLISPLPPPIGGIATWSVNLISFLSDNKYGIDLIHQNSAVAYGSFSINNILSRIFSGVIESIRIINQLKRNIISCNPDVIHLTSSASLALFKDFFILKIAKRHEIPVVIHWRFGRIPILANKKNWEWKFLCNNILKSHASIVIDKKSYLSLLQAGFSNVFIVPNPLGSSINVSTANLKERIFQLEHGILVYAGYIEKNKGVYELVEACLHLHNVKELLLIGPCCEKVKRTLILTAAGRENGTWLKFLGEIPNSKVLEHLKKSSLFILPSYTEGFPNVLLEALAVGCPVIATDVGAIPEILAFETSKPSGICIPARNVDELKKAINNVLNNPNMVEKMRTNGIENVLSNYTMEKVIDQYITVWEKVKKNKTSNADL